MSKSRKELNENELADAITDKFDLIKPHLPKIILGFAAIVAVVFGVNYMLSSRSAAKEQKSINMVLFSVENSAAGSLATLDKQIEDFPDDNSAAWAYMLKADRELTSGLQKVFVDKLAGKDFIQKSIKNFEQAIKVGGEDDFLKQRALFGWARALETLEQFDEAVAKYKELAEFEDSPFKSLAEKAIVRVQNPDNQEFFVLYNEKENDVFTVTPTETAPPTNSGLPARPDFTYPGEEVVSGGAETNVQSKDGPTGTDDKDAETKVEPKKGDAPPAPPKTVVGDDKDDSSNPQSPKAAGKEIEEKEADKSAQPDPAAEEGKKVDSDNETKNEEKKKD